VGRFFWAFLYPATQEQQREEEQQSILTGQNRTAVSPLSCVTMPPSTGLPCTANIDRNILNHFREVCRRNDALIHPRKKKQKAANSTPQETADRLSSLPEEEIARHSQILGMYLGKRLHAKYCQVIASKLGQDGYAILDLLPSNSPRWKEEQKKTLLIWFYFELKKHLASVEAIKPTFSQVKI